MERTIFALFDDALTALGVAGAFERAGHDRDAISLLVPDPRGRYAQANEPAAPHVRRFQPLTSPGLGPAAVTGPLAPSFLEQRGLVESLVALGFAEPAARHFFESLRKGQAVIAVGLAADRARDAVELMRRFGARAVEEVEPDAKAPPEAGNGHALRGSPPVDSQVVEEPAQKSISLREERLRVERRAVSREAAEADLADFRDCSFEFYETVEEPVITKRRRVVEEIVVDRELRERIETISETARNTQGKGEPETAA